MTIDDSTLQRYGRPITTEGPVRLGPPGQASLYLIDPFGNHLELECKGFAEPIPLRAPDMARLASK